MSRDEDFLQRWRTEKRIYEAWGNHLTDRLRDELAARIAPIGINYFLKAPPSARCKADSKLVEKAFYRAKAYADPYDQITDKVGTRFVVLLGQDIAKVVDALKAIGEWTWTKDRDYEEEQNRNPISFTYAAVHFVVRTRGDLEIAGLRVPAGTPCELQIKTILQHAYSELTHDTIYKPQIKATPSMQRDAAKAMALLEATNDYFEKVATEVNAALKGVREITANLSAVYRSAIGFDPIPSTLEGLLLEAYEQYAGLDYVDRAREMLEHRPFLTARISEGVEHSNPLFLQPSILLAYLDIVANGRYAEERWPLTGDELEPLLNHLGTSLDT